MIAPGANPLAEQGELTLRAADTATAARNRLLPEGRMTGPMPWVIAIIMFLTVLASAAGLALSSGLSGLHAQLSGKLTLQLVESDNDQRTRLIERLLPALRAHPAVATATQVPDARLAEQVRPWLGGDMAELDLPLPALIDIELRPGAPADASAQLATLAGRLAPQARLETDMSFLGPVERLMRTLLWLAAGLVLLMLVATGSIVALAARGAHDAHRDTIEVLHLLGSTDVQIARLFQRRMALDTLFGGMVGTAAAVVAIWGLRTYITGHDSELLRLSSMPLWGWAALFLVPLSAVLLSAGIARMTIRRTLEKSL